MGGQRGLLAIVAGIVVLVVVTVVVVLVAGARPPRVYPVGSPEAALQAFLAASEAGDSETAYESFSQAIRGQTSLAEYRRMTAQYRTWNQPPNGPSRRAFIDRTTISGDRATLDLTIEETYVSGLSTSRNRHGREVTMARESGAWRLDQLLVGLDPHFDKMDAEMYPPEAAPTAPGAATSSPTSQP